MTGVQTCALPIFERLYRYGKRQLIDLLTVRKSHEYRRLSVGRRRYPLIRYDPCKALLYAVRIGELRVDDISLIKLLILSEGFKLRRYVASCVGSRRDIRRISVFGYADVSELFLSRYLREAYAKPEGLVVGCPCMCFLPSENIGRYYIVYRPSGVVGAVTLQLYREYLGPIIYRTRKIYLIDAAPRCYRKSVAACATYSDRKSVV